MKSNIRVLIAKPGLDGNVCCCTGYTKVFDAVAAVAGIEDEGNSDVCCCHSDWCSVGRVKYNATRRIDGSDNIFTVGFSAFNPPYDCLYP